VTSLPFRSGRHFIIRIPSSLCGLGEDGHPLSLKSPGGLSSTTALRLRSLAALSKFHSRETQPFSLVNAFCMSTTISADCSKVDFNGFGAALNWSMFHYVYDLLNGARSVRGQLMVDDRVHRTVAASSPKIERKANGGQPDFDTEGPS
jgi:hypothetical protein